MLSFVENRRIFIFKRGVSFFSIAADCRFVFFLMRFFWDLFRNFFIFEIIFCFFIGGCCSVVDFSFLIFLRLFFGGLYSVSFEFDIDFVFLLNDFFELEIDIEDRL